MMTGLPLMIPENGAKQIKPLAIAKGFICLFVRLNNAQTGN